MMNLPLDSLTLGASALAHWHSARAKMDGLDVKDAQHRPERRAEEHRRREHDGGREHECPRDPPP
jgi:hypothetical protein